MTQEETQKGGATLYNQKSRHIWKQSYIHTYQTRRTIATSSGFATALGSKTIGYTKKGVTSSFPQQGGVQVES